MQGVYEYPLFRDPHQQSDPESGYIQSQLLSVFEDKEDLLGCIAESWVDVILRKLTEAFRVSDGSYYESMKLWMSQALENDISREVWKVYNGSWKKRISQGKARWGLYSLRQVPSGVRS